MLGTPGMRSAPRRPRGCRGVSASALFSPARQSGSDRKSSAVSTTWITLTER